MGSRESLFVTFSIQLAVGVGEPVRTGQTMEVERKGLLIWY